MITEYRASSWPRVMACPGSIVPPEIETVDDEDASNMGSCVHAVMYSIVLSSADEVPPLVDSAKKFGVTDMDELSILCHQALKIWKAIRDEVDVLAIEQQMRRDVVAEPQKELTESEKYDLLEMMREEKKAKGARPTLEDAHVARGAVHPDDIRAVTGSPDIVLRPKRTGRLTILDWKTGRKDRDYSDQMMAYIYLAHGRAYTEYDLANNSDVIGKDGADYVLAWVRTGEIEERHVTPKQMDAWLTKARKAMLSPNLRRTGPQCEFCPLWAECEKRQTVVRAACMELAPPECDPKTMLISRETLAAIHPRWVLVKKAVARYEELLKAEVRRGGALALPDGFEVAYVQQDQKRVAKPLAALQALQKHFGKDTLEATVEYLEEAITLGKGALEQIAKARVEKNKGRAQEVMVAALEAAGALENQVVEKLTVRRKEQ